QARRRALERRSRESETVPRDDSADARRVRAVVRQEAVRRVRQEGQVEDGPGGAAAPGHRGLQEEEQPLALRRRVVRLDRGLQRAERRALDAGEVRKRVEGLRRE